MTKEKLKEIIDRLILLSEHSDSILSIRGGRGYAPGHPYPKKMEKPGYGDLDPFNARKKEKEQIIQTGPVEISRAYNRKESKNKND